ncbi:MAG: hypothetical protein K9L22_05145 [Methylococcaceae bacterium]|nr:hypothetical protein [Methylococcaceae bacterium]
MRQIDPCNYWQQIKSETPELIEYLAADTTLSPEIVKFLAASVLLPELEQIEVPKVISEELDAYELAMIA